MYGWRRGTPASEGATWGGGEAGLGDEREAEELVALVTPDQSDNSGPSTGMGQTRPEEVVAERFPALPRGTGAD